MAMLDLRVQARIRVTVEPSGISVVLWDIWYYFVLALNFECYSVKDFVTYICAKCSINNFYLISSKTAIDIRSNTHQFKMLCDDSNPETSIHF